MSLTEVNQLARSLGSVNTTSVDTAYDAPWNQQMGGLANVIYTTKAEPMSYNASAVLK